MAYTYRLFASIDEVDLAAWERLRAECGGSIFLDPRFVGAIETSMKENCRFWYVIVYQDGGQPVACACLTGMSIDLADFADPGLAWVMRHLPAWLSRLRHWKLMFCGFPISTGHHALALAPQCASAQILLMLDGVISRLALEMRADAVVYREFEQDDLPWTKPLLNLGYHRVATPPAHFFKPIFEDLEHYCAALKSHYRKQIKRSIRKLKEAGVKTTVLTTPEQILKVYTSEVHGLYHQMREKADTKFDTLSIDFLRELSSRLGDQLNLILLADGSKIIAFGWCLRTTSHYHMMYAGLDYALNEELDLYFNLHYTALDCALRNRVSKIELGLTAESFKARLGCYSEPLHVFMRGVGPFMSFMVRCGANFLFTQRPATPPFDVFKSDAGNSVK
jgi:predicted N-acyltransferase